MSVYEDATFNLHGNLVIDCDPKPPKEFKLKRNTYLGDHTIGYINKC